MAAASSFVDLGQAAGRGGAAENVVGLPGELDSALRRVPGGGRAVGFDEGPSGDRADIREDPLQVKLSAPVCVEVREFRGTEEIGEGVSELRVVRCERSLEHAASLPEPKVGRGQPVNSRKD